MFNVTNYGSMTFSVKFNKAILFEVTELLIACSFALMQKNQKIKTVRKNLEIQRCTSLKFLNSLALNSPVDIKVLLYILSASSNPSDAGQAERIFNVRCTGISGDFS